MDFSQNEPREYAGPASFPDVMNDPAYATNTEKGFEEPDTCRICRGEGLEDDQLFYPCKCSGSIKFVHQSCLVEWLGHSQKKHCELCKTPFRFTKLYDPHMPRDLPAPLFVRQLAIHSFHTVVTWLRLGLVAFVWLGWLPWSMRAIWRALFWLADGHWPGGDGSQAKFAPNGTALTEATVASTSPTSTHSMQTDIPAVQPSVSSMFSYAAGEPLMLTLMKKTLSTLFSPTLLSTTGPVNTTVTASSYKQRHPSWLSDVKFLNSLTPSPTINNIIIDTLEGQLITLLVVISFILVFLIREWVVQQQPMANIADGEREAAVQLIANHRPHQEADPQPELQPQPLLQPEDEGAEEHIEHISDHEEEEELPSTHEGPFFRGEDRINFQGTASEGSSTSSIFPHAGSDDRETNFHQPTEPLSTHTKQRLPSADVLVGLWARCNGNPDQILRVIEEEGRQEELDWIVSLMTKIRLNGLSQPTLGSDHFDLDLSGATPHSEANETAMDMDEAEQRLSALLEFLQTKSEDDPAPFVDVGPSQDVPRPFSPRFGDDSGMGSSQRAFTFDFRETDIGIPEAAGNEPVEQPGSTTSPNNEIRAANEPATQGASNAEAGPSQSHPRPLQTEQPARRVPESLIERVFDFFWADVTPDDQTQEDPQQDDEHIVEDPALEAPFIPIQNNRRFANDGMQDDDQDFAAAAGEDDIDENDADAIEEADDLEGILELIGMQGPIFGLLQNGVFSALLISFTVAIGIWLPYLWGKIALVLLANPVELIFRVPMTTVSIIADVTLDTLIGSLGYVIYSLSIICKVLLSPFGSFVPLGNWVPRTKSVTSASLSLIDASSHRLRNVVNAFFVFHESDVPLFSVLSHQALKTHQARIVGLCRTIFAICRFILHGLPLRIISLDLRDALSFDYKTMDFASILSQAREQVYNSVHHSYVSLSNTKWVNVGLTKTTTFNISSDYPDLAVWDTKDRVIAIIMGYVLASFLGLLYLRITGILSGVTRGQRIEGLMADVLHQAGGVMKVILIIGIEMIVFPLYCGSLLDIALLPLFENATIASRLEFTATSTLTSLFVHWFVGTCYMFHFALFVSMCRKVMRSGVLYFIRDPDDPTFHPVRDVLERNITTQLRKIAFSAMVYGALVIVCLGGVVWGLFYAFDGVLPVHWSASVPVLEFPVDLLFYNFVMPLAIRSLKPSDGLHSLYDWWFHRCARFLRLTNFFFGERRPDEEGHHVRRTWWDVISGKTGDIQHPVTNEEQRPRTDENDTGAYFLRDGRFVRAPASDQVRIPKGSQVFLEVTEDNKRLDGAPDSDGGLHGSNSDMFTKVYVPSIFRVRIAAFILSIWAFAAVTGVGITVIPLVAGRKILSSCFPNGTPPNDIYAFSSGICVVGGAAYSAWYCRTGFAALRDHLRPYLRSPREACVGFFNAVISGLGLLYVLTSFSVLLPSLVALVLELYVLVPLHTYLGGTQAHVIHFVQDWTLGVLYVQMAIKFMLSNSTTRPAVAFKGIFRDNWLKPNVRLATRALLLPITLAIAIAVVIPLALGFVLNSAIPGSSLEVQSKVYRYAYPLTLVVSLVMWITYLVRRQVDIWRVNVRDDVYLIGERLHNFTDKRGKDVGVSQRVSTR